MKCYYKTLNDDKKEKIKESFLRSKDIVLYNKANRICKICIFGIIFSIFTFVFDFVYYSSVLNLILDGFLFIISVVFYIKMNNIKIKELNKFALKNKE